MRSRELLPFPLLTHNLAYLKLSNGRFRPCEYDLNHGPWDPVTGGTLAIFDLFYDVFKGLGEIGSEFTRIPNVGQRGESSKSSQSINVSALPPTPSSSKVDDKIVGERAAKGLGRMTKAALRSPMTFSVGMAQGAHNLPKLWGDKTVRPQEKITGIGSGLKAAGKVYHLFIPILTHSYGVSPAMRALACLS